MEYSEEWHDIDTCFYKIIESWNMSEGQMSKELNEMVSNGMLEKAMHRKNIIETIIKIVEVAKEQRVVLAILSKEYNIDKKLENECKYDPVECLAVLFEDNSYFKGLSERLDSLVEKVDTNKLFSKKSIDLSKKIDEHSNRS